MSLVVNDGLRDLRAEVPMWRNPLTFTAERFDYDRGRVIAKLQEVANAWLACQFSDAFPNFHEMHLLHPNPVEARDLALISLRVRKIGWRAAEWKATFEGLDNTDHTHFAWILGHLIGRPKFLETTRAWDLSVPFRTPDGIPITRPSLEQHEQWQPETNLWDVEDAAMHELELGMGGPASMYLHDLLTATGSLTVGTVNAPGKTDREVNRARVVQYLNHYRTIPLSRDLPEDIYSPLYWGHDARLKSLVLTEPVAVGSTVIALTPDFDPETLSYTTGQPLVGMGMSGTFFDPFLNLRDDTSTKFNEDNTQVTITVTAKDGVTSRAYVISVQ